MRSGCAWSREGTGKSRHETAASITITMIASHRAASAAVDVRRGLSVSALIAVLAGAPLLLGMDTPALLIGGFALLLNIVGVLMGTVMIRRDAVALHGGRVLLYFLLVMAATLMISQHVDSARNRAQDVIAALDRYRLDHGDYPESLDALVPGYLSLIPPAVDRPLKRSDFRYRRSLDRFYLGFSSGLMLQSIYESDTGKWSQRD